MKISKNEHTLDVSPDTYKIMYKRLGYKPVTEKQEKLKEEIKPKEVEEVKPKEEIKNNKK